MNLINNLKVGDIIVVSTVLFKEREYKVTKVEGNRAYTGFRIFNTRIYPPNMIYEYGKRVDPSPYANGYWLKTKQ